MDEIAQYWLVIKRRWLPATLVFAITTALAALWTQNQTEVFQAKGQVILKKTNKASTLLSSVANAAGGGSMGELDGLTGSTPVNTQAEILKSLTNVNGVLTELRDGKYKTRPEIKQIDKFIKNSESFVQQLKVSPIKNTDILEVTFQNTSKEFTKDVVEKTMEVYIRDDQKNQRREAEAARKFVSQELPKIETE
ncbi:MAG: hypothetical protein RLZZ135_331, partial [Cyanobacteriota bacterium]